MQLRHAQEIRETAARNSKWQLTVIGSATSDKPNVCYWVREVPNKIQDVFGPRLDKLRIQRATMGRVIDYCRRCEECALIYRFFRTELLPEFTEPIAAPNLSCFRLVDMYIYQ